MCMTHLTLTILDNDFKRKGSRDEIIIAESKFCNINVSFPKLGSLVIINRVDTEVRVGDIFSYFIERRFSEWLYVCVV